MLDSQLIKSLKEGNQEAYHVLFTQYGRSLYSLVFRMCGNKEDSEDIVQKTFLEAFRHMRDFREESGVYTWLYTIAKNQCIRLLQKRRRQSFAAMEQLMQTAQLDSEPDSYETLEKQFYINQVKEGCLLGLLRCLSLQQRMAFILNVLIGLKIQDVSAVLGKSENAVRLLVHRAKQNLKDFLCQHCSLYDAHNECRCENLIHFSLKQKWIEGFSHTSEKHNSGAALEIENEIKALKKVVLLYSSMDAQPMDKRFNHFQSEMAKKPYRIFSFRKVK